MLLGVAVVLIEIVLPKRLIEQCRGADVVGRLVGGKRAHCDTRAIVENHHAPRVVVLWDTLPNSNDIVVCFIHQPLGECSGKHDIQVSHRNTRGVKQIATPIQRGTFQNVSSGRAQPP